MSKSLRLVLDRFATLLEGVVALLFMALFLVTILNIVLRNLGGIAWLWIPGFTRLVFIWLVFLGIAAAYRRGDHLVVDFFLERMPDRVRAWTRFAIQLVLMPFFFLLFVYGRNIAEVRMRIPFDTWQFATGWAYMAVPVAAGILLAFGFERLVKLGTELRKR